MAVLIVGFANGRESIATGKIPRSRSRLRTRAYSVTICFALRGSSGFTAGGVCKLVAIFEISYTACARTDDRRFSQGPTAEDAEESNSEFGIRNLEFVRSL